MVALADSGSLRSRESSKSLPRVGEEVDEAGDLVVGQLLGGLVADVDSVEAPPEDLVVHEDGLPVAAEPDVGLEAARTEGQPLCERLQGVLGCVRHAPPMGERDDPHPAILAPPRGGRGTVTDDPQGALAGCRTLAHGHDSGGVPTLRRREAAVP